MCRKIEIKTGKCTLLVIELPVDIKNINLFAKKKTNHYRLYYDEGKMDLKGLIGNHGIIDFGVGNWQHIGTLDQMTEEVWKGIVDGMGRSIATGVPYFRDYYGYDEDDVVYTAIESGISLLKYNEVMFENPLGENGDTGHNARDREWQEAQEKLFDLKRTHFFIKIQ